MIKRKKKEVEIPIWDREQEYQDLKKAHDQAQFCYLDYQGSDETERQRLETEWLKLKKLYDPLYVQREEWLKETGTHPKVQKKEGLSKETKVMAGLTIAGWAVPMAAEHFGIILRSAKDITSKCWSYAMGTFKKK